MHAALFRQLEPKRRARLPDESRIPALALVVRAKGRAFVTIAGSSTDVTSGDDVIIQRSIVSDLFKSQRYSVSWSPGRKLSSSVSFQESDTRTVRRTSGVSGNLNYQPNRWAKLWLTLTRSETEQVGITRSEIRTARLGVNLFF